MRKVDRAFIEKTFKTYWERNGKQMERQIMFMNQKEFQQFFYPFSSPVNALPHCSTDKNAAVRELQVPQVNIKISAAVL